MRTHMGTQMNADERRRTQTNADEDVNADEDGNADERR
jgi:hypothetical protein